MLSWARDDQAFSAAGACHILAYAFHESHPEGEIIYTRPLGDHLGNHVYVRTGDWAFDFAGWTKEAEILAVMHAAYEPMYPGWAVELVTITDLTIHEYCRRYGMRRPEAYAHGSSTRNLSCSAAMLP